MVGFLVYRWVRGRSAGERGVRSGGERGRLQGGTFSRATGTGERGGVRLGGERSGNRVIAECSDCRVLSIRLWGRGKGRKCGGEWGGLAALRGGTPLLLGGSRGEGAGAGCRVQQVVSWFTPG